jgi:hypothetical protein
MKKLILSVPDVLKLKLDHMRTQGFTINGFVVATLERTLADTPTDRRLRKGRRATT